MENIKECPVCSNNKFDQYLDIKDYFLSKEDFHLSKCPECGFVFTNPRPKENDIGSYYKSDKYFSHADSKKGILQKIYSLARNYSVRKKYKLLNSLVESKGTILDYGCGTGEVLSEFKKNQWTTFGVEPDENSRDFAINNHGLEVYKPEEFLQHPIEPKYDIISLWHVLEHVHNLNDLIQNLSIKLKKEGKLIIAVPNIDCFDAEVFGNFWAAYDVPRHLYHFNNHSIIELFSNHNFRLNEIYPMKLDSFYVSMLSNEHKFGSKKYLNSFLTGLRSNFKADKNNYSYSSTIYVFSKKGS